MCCFRRRQEIELVTFSGMSDRWGFEEDDEWDVVDESAEPVSDGDDFLRGTDPDGIVTVAVTENAEVRSVMLTPDWKSAVDPRGLHSHVVAAMNAATMQALARQVERAGLSDSSSPGTGAPPATSDRLTEETPITKEDAMRLVDAATADLERFMSRASTIADAVISIESAGGHVMVSGRQRQVREVTIDADWAGRVRPTEIEAELLDVLRRFGAESDLGELAQGPRSPAITELQNLAADPHALVRRITRAHQGGGNP